MRPRNETDRRPAVAGLLVVVAARDEEDEVVGSLSGVAAAAAEVEVPVVVSVVLDRCGDGTAHRVEHVLQIHPHVRWAVLDSDATTLGGARAAGVLAGRTDAALASLDPAAVWVATTDADSRVPSTWLRVQRDLADTGVDLVLGSVEPRDDGSASVGLWSGGGIADDHLTIRAASLGVRLSAYDVAGGFPDLDEREDVELVHAVREGAGLPWTSTDRARVVTSARRDGRRERGFARFLRRLDDTVAGVRPRDGLMEMLRAALLRLAQERGPGKTLCPSEAAAAVDPGRRRELTHLARAVACILADEGLVVITQKGVPVDGRTSPGPVRVGLPAATGR